MNEDEIIVEPSIDTDDESHKALHQIRRKLENPDFLNYSANLEQDATKEGIKVAAVEPTELDQEEQVLEKERILGITSLAKAHHTHQLQLLSKEQEARQKLQQQYSKQQKTYKHIKDNSAHTHQLNQIAISKVFRRKELAVKTAMRKKKADIEVKLQKTSNKEGKEDDQLLLGGITRVYKLTWRGRPQVAEIRIEECRDIKDKLERGEYWIRLTTKDKIGGKILEYEKLTEIWRNISDPYTHDGKYTNKSMKFKTTMKVLVPSRLQILPTMVYCFQILDFNSVIVGEGYFPIINNVFELNEGKFKVPMIRSSLKSSIDKFSGIESLYRSNIDEWLCNLYFQISVLPQVIEGESDYSVQLLGNQVVQEEIPSAFPIINYEELITPDQYSEYKYSVVKQGVLTTPKNKLQYIIAEIIVEFGFKPIRHWAIYFSLVLFIGMVWLSRYIHYSGQWLYIKVERYPEEIFTARLFTLEIRFSDNTNLRQEIILLFIGTIFQCFWFAFFCAWAWASLKWIGRYPELAFRLMQTWGVVMVLDPIITIGEALIWGFVYDYWGIDPFRLYNYFERAEGNGVVGVLLTIFLYAGLMGLCAFVVYNYFIFLHMNGRLLDMYMRLNASENTFFIPHDGEVSKRYLEWVCYKAKNYRSMNGDSRIISVMDYSMHEAFSTEVTKSATHVIIYTVGSDRSRALYRQFIRLPDGAISELSLMEHSHRMTYSQRYSGSSTPIKLR